MEKNKKKTVRLDKDNQLIIENDNAIITAGSVFSEINGDYLISSDTIEKLMVIVNKQTMLKRNVFPEYYISNTIIPEHTNYVMLTSDETSIILNQVNQDLENEIYELRKELANKIEELTKENETLKSEAHNLTLLLRKTEFELVQVESKYKRLLQKIEGYNNARLFNKLKINEEDNL